MPFPLHSRLMLIINPTAGKNQARNHIFTVIDQFFRAGYQVTVFPTQQKGDATQYVLRLAAEYDRVVCIGGDGTLNEVVSGLMQLPEEQRPLLGYIPAGTTNDFASTLGIPTEPELAIEQIVEGAPFWCDVGMFNQQYFTYVAAFGLFTEVSYATPQTLKNTLGHFAYILEGIKSLSMVHSYRMTFDVDGEEIEDEFIYGQISNSTSIGGVMDIANTGVRLDDGLFEVLLIQMPRNPLELNEIISALLMQKIEDCPRIYFRRGRQIHCTAYKPTAWTLDGESGGVLIETDAQIIPHAIPFLIKRENAAQEPDAPDEPETDG